MANKPAPATAGGVDPASVDRAYRAALDFLDLWQTLECCVKRGGDPGWAYAQAWFHWQGLRAALTPATRQEVALVHRCGHRGFRLRGVEPKPTMIGAVEALGERFQEAVYRGSDPYMQAIDEEARRRTPSDYVGEAIEVFKEASVNPALREEAAARVEEDWKGLDRAGAADALKRLRSDAPDFKIVAVNLQRERDAVRDRLQRAAERAMENIARVSGGADDNGHAKPPALPAGADECDDPTLTHSEWLVLQTMAREGSARLLSVAAIVDRMDPKEQLSEETVRVCVGKLIESKLAERPDGRRSGARLNRAGRELAGKTAGKIAD